MTVLFLPDAHWNDDRQIVQFYAVDQLNRIPCAISKEALDDHFQNGANPPDIFRSNRDPIEAIASKLIAHDRFESDGSILIRTSDC
jgi:Protein of unknown function (DUF1488)